MKKQSQTQTLQSKMQNFAKLSANECKKFYTPDNSSHKKMDAAINVVCLRAMQFKQKHPLNVVDVIKITMMVRKELKIMDFNSAFINKITMRLMKILLNL